MRLKRRPVGTPPISLRRPGAHFVAPAGLQIKKYKAASLENKNIQSLSDSWILTGYSAAAGMFAEGKIDGMFSGSGVAGCLIIMGLADPLVRPQSREGWDTYRAVVLAPRGAPPFVQCADYFKNKTVIFCSLAPSGEFFFRSIKGNAAPGVRVKKAVSHHAAIDTLSRGFADVAIVKNRVWDEVKRRYPGIVSVGEAVCENPNGTLMVSKRVDPAIAKKLRAVLLGIDNDGSTGAAAGGRRSVF